MTSIDLVLPSRLTGSTMRYFVQDFITKCANVVPTEIYIDFKSLTFIEPAGITFLSNFVAWNHRSNIKSYFRNHQILSPPINFLDDSLFFYQHTGEQIRQNASPRSTTKPLLRLEYSDSHAWLRSHFTPWLSSRTGYTNASFHPIQVCLSEIFNNINDHTELTNGSMFMQHFPKINKISISVADFGRGIPASVRSLFPVLDDDTAIIKAVEPGFTTKSTPRNRGAGLDYLLQSVVSTNQGEVTISSLGGCVCFRPSGTVRLGSGPFITPGFCPGTTIDISLRTDTIPNIVDEPEDLEW